MLRVGEKVLKKLAVGATYPPNLRFFSAMDLVGADLVGRFPDWERGSLNLEVRNKKKHNRVFVAHNQILYDSLGPEAEDAEVARVREILETASKRLQVPKCKRFAARFWYVVSVENDYATSVRAFYEKFCAQQESIPFLRAQKLADSAFSVEFEKDGWQCGFRGGPIKSEQWFASVFHQRKAFEDEPGGATFEEFSRSIPKEFMFWDIEIYREDILVEEARNSFRRLFRKAQELAEAATEYVRR